MSLGHVVESRYDYAQHASRVARTAQRRCRCRAPTRAGTGSSIRNCRAVLAIADRGVGPHRFLERKDTGSMKFGTIGAGTVALSFAREALARGHEVVLSSHRGPDALADKVAKLGRGASAAPVEEAASLDYALLAVPWRNLESALKELPAWNGRVLIDATNPFVETSPNLVLADRWWLPWPRAPVSSRRSTRSSPPASTRGL
jgi:hypothetical protein